VCFIQSFFAYPTRFITFLCEFIFQLSDEIFLFENGALNPTDPIIKTYILNITCRIPNFLLNCSFDIDLCDKSVSFMKLSRVADTCRISNSAFSAVRLHGFAGFAYPCLFRKWDAGQAAAFGEILFLYDWIGSSRVATLLP